jgi:predicted RNA binding protein YcfA (HicA-like mRNA interferase family)
MGFEQAQQRGSHVVMHRNNDGCVVPLHKELAVGTLAGILKQAKVTPEEFLEHMK